MASVRSSLIKSAEDLARRANTQVLVIVSGLLLGMLSIFSSQQFAYSQRHEVLTLDSKGNAMRDQYKVARQQKLRTQESAADVKREYEQAGCQPSELGPTDYCRKKIRKLEHANKLEKRLDEILHRLDERLPWVGLPVQVQNGHTFNCITRDAG